MVSTLGTKKVFVECCKYQMQTLTDSGILIHFTVQPRLMFSHRAGPYIHTRCYSEAANWLNLFLWLSLQLTTYQWTFDYFWYNTIANLLTWQCRPWRPSGHGYAEDKVLYTVRNVLRSLEVGIDAVCLSFKSFMFQPLRDKNQPDSGRISKKEKHMFNLATSENSCWGKKGIAHMNFHCVKGLCTIAHCRWVNIQ